MDDLKKHIIEKASLAKEAFKSLSHADTELKNAALLKMADSLTESMDSILQANSRDIARGREKGMSESLLDRLLLSEARIMGMADGLRQIASLEDPVGGVDKMWKRPNGITIGQMRVPLGVIGIIYEARPNVTVDATALCIKSGNAVILKGGSEAMESNKAIVKTISGACEAAGLPKGCISFIDTEDREAVNILLKLNKYVDVIIPRGSGSLINFVVQNSTVPVIQTGEGNCHIYVDESADLEMAADIVINAKTQRTGVCNAAETLLVHRGLAEEFLPLIAKRLFGKNVEIRADETSLETIRKAGLGDAGTLVPAVEKDWETEFLDLIIAVRVVDSLDEALDHIYRYSTKHSEVIVTNDYLNSQRFLREVDSAAVYVNASSRFTDGSEFGFGGEIGISTQKLHARGPMGLRELTTIKYIIYGEGQIRK
jgi:glutamate-5-semialdehyde dehydrogenase